MAYRTNHDQLAHPHRDRRGREDLDEPLDAEEQPARRRAPTRSRSSTPRATLTCSTSTTSRTSIVLSQNIPSRRSGDTSTGRRRGDRTS